MTPPSDDPNHERMLRHVAAQDEGYAAGSFNIEKRSGLYLRSRIFKELFALFCLLEDDNPGFKLTRVLEVGCGLGNISPFLRACADNVLSIDLRACFFWRMPERNPGRSDLHILPILLYMFFIRTREVANVFYSSMFLLQACFFSAGRTNGIPGEHVT